MIDKWKIGAGLLAAIMLSLAATAVHAAVAQTQPAAEESTIDQWLDRLDARGSSLETFAADLELTETDNSTMLSTTRLGTVLFQRVGKDDARMKIVFDRKRVADSPKAINEKIVYLLKDGWLTERDFRLRKQINRQVVKPGEKINLLKLGEGPFPLPIGQSRQEVHGQFEVKIIPRATDDPADAAVHLQLTPKPDSQFSRKFGSIDVWVSGKDDMPTRIAVVDRNGTTTRTTDLKNMRVNLQLDKSAFDLPALPEGWEKYEEPYGE